MKETSGCKDDDNIQQCNEYVRCEEKRFNLIYPRRCFFADFLDDD